jgi:signal transduction histidine kinase
MEETDRTLARLDEFLLLSRPEKLRRERFDLHELVVDVGELIEPDLAALEVALDVESFAYSVDADRDQVRRLVLNLLLNALALAPAVRRVRIAFDVPRGALVVEDDGPGVAAELRASLFEPYVSGREGGTGLGLAISRQIASAHGWRLELVDSQLGGAGFELVMGR